MSAWQFKAAVAGYAAAHGADAGTKLSQSEYDDLAEWILATGADGSEKSTMTYTYDGLRHVPTGVVSFFSIES